MSTKEQNHNDSELFVTAGITLILLIVLTIITLAE